MIIEEKLLENPQEAGNIGIKNMAKYALKGPNMATKRTVEEVLKTETRRDVEYD